jgi:hypothetical protein
LKLKLKRPPKKQKYAKKIVFNTKKVAEPIEYVYTPIGRLNKNNINDLLADMRHALVDMKNPKFSRKAKTKLAHLHTKMT